MKVQFMFNPSASDVADIASRLRDEDVEELMAMGAPNVLTAVQRSVAESDVVGVPVVQDTAAGVFGIASAPDGRTGFPWALFTPIVKAVRFSMVRESRRFVSVWRTCFRDLYGLVYWKNEPSIQYLQALGFFVNPDTNYHHPDFHAFYMRGY